MPANGWKKSPFHAKHMARMLGEEHPDKSQRWPTSQIRPENRTSYKVADMMEVPEKRRRMLGKEHPHALATNSLVTIVEMKVTYTQ
jgi:hypothetical protein